MQDFDVNRVSPPNISNVNVYREVLVRFQYCPWISLQYMGRWFKITGYEHFFELGLSCITADYFINSSESPPGLSLLPVITVKNRGHSQMYALHQSLWSVLFVKHIVNWRVFRHNEEVVSDGTAYHPAEIGPPSKLKLHFPNGNLLPYCTTYACLNKAESPLSIFFVLINSDWSRNDSRRFGLLGVYYFVWCFSGKSGEERHNLYCVQVLDTDYNTFAVVWSCIEMKIFGASFINAQMLWILGRNPILPETTIEDVKERYCIYSMSCRTVPWLLIWGHCVCTWIFCLISG